MGADSLPRVAVACLAALFASLFYGSLGVLLNNCCECERSSYHDVTCVRLPLQVCCCVHIYLFSFPL
jgi:hypothetical protein